jgi:hypothetical protein
VTAPNRWLEEWVQESLRAVLPEGASIEAQAESPHAVHIAWPVPASQATSRRLKSITLRFDQGVHASLSVATPECRVEMGKRLQELFDRSVSHSYNTTQPLDERLTVYIDSSISVRSESNNQ